MRALDRKLLRDLWRMKSQALAIALVITSGVGTFVMSLSTLHSLQETRTTFYRDHRFADVFASLKRAPESVREQIAAIPGVQLVETRVVAAVNLDLEDFPDPATARLISIAESGEPLLNGIYLREGRLVNPLRDDEVVASEAFCQAHGLEPGDRIFAILNGRRKGLTIVGIALSPEVVYQIRPGDFFPDFKAYAILWMAHRPLATAYDMYGAFNDVALTLSARTNPEAVITRLDLLLARYGGFGAYARKDQLSHRYLNEEFRQLETMATIFPFVFLSVAAFLLNVVVSRLIRTQRDQIATLKAFGYSNFAIAIHYSKLIVAIVLFGVAGGVALGIWLAQGMSEMYMQFYKFPYIRYILQPSVVAGAALASIGAGLAGTLFSLREAVSQAPAEAMRPEPPARYRRTIFERLGLGRFLSEPTRMILRDIERRPVKSMLTVVGIAFACSILIMGRFSKDSVDYMIDVQFRLAQRDDITVTFFEPTSRAAFYELLRLPGIEHAEAFRAAPVRLRFGHRSYRTAIQGLTPGGDLVRPLSTALEPIELPEEGVVLTDFLGGILDVRPGDMLTVEVLEGARPVRTVQVAGLANEYVGVNAYMRLDALNRLLREGTAISGAHLATDKSMQQQVYRELKDMPRVAGTVVRENAIKSLNETMAEQLLTFALINTMLASTIAFGVVYNSARISLSERGRELASLRVLGFTRGEVSYILLGELAIFTLAALPVGFAVGTGLCAYFIQSLTTDLFRVPLVIQNSTYSFAALVVVVCSIVSGLVVRRRIDRLDLVGVLKTRE